MTVSAPLVETSYGRVQGTDEDGIRVFRGIPFARPPVGPLRFRPPERPEPWPGVRDATRFGPGSFQAARALAYRNPTSFSIDGQADLLAKEPSPKIRMELLNNLGRALEDDPGKLRSILETMASSDPSEELRAEAQKWLKAG